MHADLAVHSIFLSYSSKHRDLTRALAEAIELQYGTGSVWWDQALESWGDYEIQIRNVLNEARVVVVLWTKSAAESDWVKSEAGRANRDGKLVNVRPSDTSWSEVPSPYDQHHVTDLADTLGILRSIDAVWTGRTIRTAIPLHEIYWRQHGERLIDSKQRALPRDRRDVSPSELLQAKFEVVGYADLTGIRAQLLQWCTESGRATAAQLVHGPGGVGKTRLMISVAALLRDQGWTTGFLDRPREVSEATLKQRQQALEQLINHGDDDGLLIVVDYAEKRQDEVKSLGFLLSRRADGETRPIRLVLLARSAGEWWTTLHDETPEIQKLFRRTGAGSVVTELPPVTSGEQRRAFFAASLAAFGSLLEAQGFARRAGKPSLAHVRRIETHAGYSRPLAIQMEALIWLSSAGGASGSGDVEELLRLVLGLERNHWRKILGVLDEEDMRDLARGVAQVTVVRGTPTVESAERLLMADDFYRGRRTARIDVDRVRRNLARVYGKADGRIIPLEPDLIGEHHVISVGDIGLVEGCLRWIEGEPAELQEQHRRDVLTVLQRATQSEHGTQAAARATALLDHLVRAHAITLAAALVAVMVDTPGALVGVLDRTLEDLNSNALRALGDALPLESLLLLDVSLKIAARLVDLARRALAAAEGKGEGDADRVKSDLALRLGMLGVRLANLGRHDEAIAATEEAIVVQRHLAQARPDDFLPDLAAWLHNLSNYLNIMGRREEALAASQEAVVICRRLAEMRPDAFLSPLAISLNSVGNGLGALGRYEEALAATQEAVAIRRRLTETRPDEFMPEIAGELNNLGNRLSNLGHREQALATRREAVATFKRLAETRPDAYLPDLATSLSNLGAGLSDLGHLEEALAATQESLAIRRRLAETRPDVFLPDLAGSLHNLGSDLSDLGHLEEALAATQEALAIRRRLAETRPDTFLADVAASLTTLGVELERLGHGEHAYAASREAVGIYLELSRPRPDAFLLDLVRSAAVMSRALALLDNFEMAARGGHLALTCLVPFLERHPDVFRELARTVLHDVIRYSEAASEKPDSDLLKRVAQALGDSKLISGG